MNPNFGGNAFPPSAFSEYIIPDTKISMVFPIASVATLNLCSNIVIDETFPELKALLFWFTTNHALNNTSPRSRYRSLTGGAGEEYKRMVSGRCRWAWQR